MFEAATIKISGPGLVVNGPAAIIYKALAEAGYDVQMEEFDGQFDGERDKDTWLESELFDLKSRTKDWFVKIDVHPQPWGS